MSRPRTIAAALAAAVLATPSAAAPLGHTAVVEFRQYRLEPGQRDAFVALFDREFVDSQEALGMRLVGQFRDLDDPNRFVWIRAFEDMAPRPGRLGALYGGPVWKAHGRAANGMMRNSENVLLLKPARAGSGFAPAATPRAPAGAAPARADLIVATIHYLWDEPGQGFAELFERRMRPELEAAGLPVIAALVPERAANNFPALPVREGEDVFVWFTRAKSPTAHAAALKRLKARPGYRALQSALKDAQDRAPQVLRLLPTPRSELR